MTKKLPVIFFALILVVGVCVCGLGVNSGVALADEKITITDADGLIALSNEVTSGEMCLGREYVLGTDIDLTGTSFAPIGTVSTRFQGAFFGNGHTITLDFNDVGDGYGLFGYLGSSGIVDGVVVDGNVSGENTIGAIVAHNEGTVINSISSANVVGNKKVGGIVGDNRGKVISCVSTGVIKGLESFGGIVGENTTTSAMISGCVSLATLNSNSAISVLNVGGVVGKNSSSINNSYAYAKIDLVANNVANVGAVVGYLDRLGTSTEKNYGIESVYSAVGYSTVSGYNNSFVKKGEKESLIEGNVEFSEGIYGEVNNLEGYDYLPVPKFLVEDGGFKSEYLTYSENFSVLLFGDGEGTEVDPFLIDSDVVWQLFSVNSLDFDYAGKYIKLAFDVTVPTEFVIGSEARKFRGNFDGNDKTATLSGNSIFAHLGNNANVSNLILGGNVSGTVDIGGLTKAIDGTDVTIDNVVNEATVVGTNNVGGLVGKVSNLATVSIINCINEGKVNGNNYVGGIIGDSLGSITVNGSANYAIITSELNAASSIGGLFGRVGEVNEINNVHNAGAVNATKATDVGGIVGKFTEEASLVAVSNFATVNGRFNVGGIVGGITKNVAITDFAVIANLKGANYVGGIVGNNGLSLSLTRGYYVGKITEDTTVSKTEAFVSEVMSNGNVTASETYYNADVVNAKSKLNATAYNSIQMSDGTFFDAQLEWTVSDMQVEYGVYPYVNASYVTVNSAITVNYFDMKQEGYLVIASEQAMKNFVYLSNNYADYDSYDYRLGGDVRLNSDIGFVNNFGGEFDGNGYVISGLNVNSNSSLVALFGTLSGSVKNLGIVGSVTSDNESGVTASLVALLESTASVTNCYADVTVSSVKVGGGLIGNNLGLVEECFATGLVSGDIVGGLVGTNSGIVKNSFFNGIALSNKDNGIVGGIAGKLTAGELSYVYANGRVDGDNAGGIVGVTEGSPIISYAIAYSEIVGDNKFGIMTSVMGTSTIIASYYHSSVNAGINAYPDVADNTVYARTTENIRLSSFVVNGYSHFDTTYNDDFDAYMGCTLVALDDWANNNAVVDLNRKESVEMRIYGSNTATLEEYGSENNPYLITNADQIAGLSALTLNTSYESKYFRIDCDIDMSTATVNGGKTYAIGYFESASSANNVYFDGIIYGQQPYSITNVNVNEAINKNNVIVTSYLGVFAYTGPHFELRDLRFYGNVSGGNEIGSLVGYMAGGKIEGVYSAINVTASGDSAGGLVAEATNGITIIDSVYDGEITANGSAYGIIGVNADAISANLTNTWYIMDIEDDGVYVHNAYGSRLIVDNDPNANGTITFERKTDVRGYGISLTANAGYYGYVTNTNDDAVSTAGVTYYPIVGGSVASGTSVVYYVRYCRVAEVKVNGSGASDIAAIQTKGQGRYYVGQKVSMSLEWQQYGYRLSSVLDKNDNEIDYALSNTGEVINVEFVMTNDTDAINFVIDTIQPTEGTEVVVFTQASGLDYDGTDRVSGIKLDAYDVSYYLTDGTAKHTVTDAGEYLIKVRELSNGVIVGVYTVNYVVEKRELTIDESKDFALLATKVYDGTNVSVTILNSEEYPGYVLNLVDGENVTITMTATYASIDVIDSVSVTFNNFSIDSDNYQLAQDSITYSQGKILKREMTITVPSAEFDGTDYVINRTYSGEKPIIDGTYAINIKWTLTKLDSNGNVDTSWTETNGYGIGTYLLTATPESAIDSNNYSLSTAEDYLVRISPYVVTEVSYANVNSLVYSANDLSANMKAYYVGVDGNNHEALLSYYVNPRVVVGTEIIGEFFVLQNGKVIECDHSAFLDNVIYLTKSTEIVNAGTYYLVAYGVNDNYIVDVEAKQVTVSRNTLGGKIEYSLSMDGQPFDLANGMSVGQKALITFTDSTSLSNGYNPRYTIELINTARGGFEIEEINGEYYLVPVTYGDSVTFRIAALGATNYTDRYSDYNTVKINSTVMYVGLEKTEYTFGDVIELKLKYYKDIDRTEEVLASEISGLTPPSAQPNTKDFNVGTYPVIYSGGESNGYVFTPLDSSIVINKREIVIAVASASTKVYGDSNESENIRYTLAEYDEDDNLVAITTLPDGREIALNGKLGRVAGENVGSYKLTWGTISEEINTNYTLVDHFSDATFDIIQREIKLVVKQGQSKEYGEEDGLLELEVAEGYELVNNALVGIKDSIALFYTAIKVNRQEGENIGNYEYYITYVQSELTRLNYNVTDVSIVEGDYFSILQETPTVIVELTGTAYFGDVIADLQYSARAFSGTTNVSGKCVLYGTKETLGISDKSIKAKFIPDNANYATVTIHNVAVNVEKRPVTIDVFAKDGDDIVIASGVKFPYKGATYGKNDFVYEVNNLVEGCDDYEVKLSFDGDCKNVTSDGFTVKATIESDYYVLNEEVAIKCSISKAQLIVGVNSVTIKQGETFKPTITYDGFVGGETKANLDELAVVENIPTESGYHTIIPSGAESKNYEFVYKGAVLVVSGTELSKGDVTLIGAFSPNVTINSDTHEYGTGAFNAVGDSIDSILGVNVFSPSAKEMKEFVSISTNVMLTEECQYVVKFEVNPEEYDLYVRTADGKVEKLEYSVEETEDGYMVTFTALNATGVALYGSKAFFDTIVSYWVYIVIVLAIIIAIAVTIIIVKTAKKERKEDRSYAVKAKWR